MMCNLGTQIWIGAICVSRRSKHVSSLARLMWPLGRSDTYAIAGRAWEPWREAGGSRVPRPLAVPMEAIGAVRQGARRTFSGMLTRATRLMDNTTDKAAIRREARSLNEDSSVLPHGFYGPPPM